MQQIVVDELYQHGYGYALTEPAGEHFDERFKPQLTPAEMLSLGIFGGDYFNAAPNEFPASWFKGVTLSPGGAQAKLNFFGVNASQPLAEWQKKGWIHPEDPKGWFLWYCRYYLGRRTGAEDERQIKRWLAMRRHISQLEASCMPGDVTCQPRRRQALLHWAYDTRTM